MYMTPIRKILCTVDFSPYSFGALHYATGIALKSDARLYVYHSIHSPRDPIYGTTEFQRGSDLEKKRTELRSGIENLMFNCPLEWDAILSVGDPVDEAVRICNDLDIDWVVAASHGISGFKRVFLGTVVERMVRHLGRPLLVVRGFSKLNRAELEKPFAGFNKIIAGCDFHADSIPCIHQAVNMTKLFQASLHLLHVMESPLNEEMIDSTAGPYGEVQQQLVEKMKARLGEILPESIRTGIEPEAEVLTGLPAEEIVDYAGRLRADLVVVGVRNHSRYDKMMIGSSTESVLRKAPCPVLAVPG